MYIFYLLRLLRVTNPVTRKTQIVIIAGLIERKRFIATLVTKEPNNKSEKNKKYISNHQQSSLSC